MWTLYCTPIVKYQQYFIRIFKLPKLVFCCLVYLKVEKDGIILRDVNKQEERDADYEYATEVWEQSCVLFTLFWSC